MRRLHFAALAAVLCCGAVPARAQTPAAEVPAGAPAPPPGDSPPPAAPTTTTPTPPAELPPAAAPEPTIPRSADLPPPDGVVAAPVPVSEPEPTAPPPERPRIEVAVGMGASIDDAGLTKDGLSAIPSFFVMGGFGDGLVGFDFGLFSNSPGRYRSPNTPIDRLDIDAMFVVRPAMAGGGLGAGDAGGGARAYLYRVLRTVALDLGAGYERSSRVAGKAEEVSRVGLRVGAHIDVPLTPAPEPGGGELRLRLAARRLIGLTTAEFADGFVLPDSRVELFAALAVVF